MQEKKTAIIAEAIVNRGGVERQILTLLRYIDADIYTGIYDPETTYPEFKNFKINCFIDKKLPPILNTFYLRRKFKKLKLPQYKNFIFFGAHATAASHNHLNIWYCNAPLRYVYDCYEDTMKDMNFIKKVFFRIFAYFIRKDDKKSFKKVDFCLVNSRNVQKRIEKYYNSYRSQILYAPINIKRFKYLGQKDYYFIASRLTPEKNVVQVAQAFQKMPDKKLIIVGDGPEKEKLEKISKQSSNVSYLGTVTEEKLCELYGNCIAVLYVTIKEDLGSIPVEAMASGKPCIGANDGGMKETIIEGKTGLLISHKIEEIIRAVNFLTPKRAKSMRKACEKRASEYSEDKWADVIKSYMRD